MAPFPKHEDDAVQTAIDMFHTLEKYNEERVNNRTSILYASNCRTYIRKGLPQNCTGVEMMLSKWK